MAYAEKRGKGTRPWRVKFKVPGGEASQSGFETKHAGNNRSRSRPTVSPHRIPRVADRDEDGELVVPAG